MKSPKFEVMEKMQIIMDINLKEILEEVNRSVSYEDGYPSCELDSKPFFNSSVNFSNTGLFILNLDMEKILWANPYFLTLNGLTEEQLYTPLLKDQLMRNLHPKDKDFLFDKASKQIMSKDSPPISKTIRFRQNDKSWKYFYFLLYSPKTNFLTKDQIKIGLLFDLNQILNHYTVMVPEKTDLACTDEEDFQKLISLSKREKEILKLIVKGFTDKEIAIRLHISNYTSEKHRKNIIQKLDVKNTACLSFLAGKYGII